MNSITVLMLTKLPPEISNIIVSYIGETYTGREMNKNIREYNYIIHSWKKEENNVISVLSFTEYIFYYENNYKKYFNLYEELKKKYKNYLFLSDEALSYLEELDNYESMEGWFDKSSIEEVLDELDVLDELEETQMDIMQEEIIEEMIDYSFEDLCPTIYDFIKLYIYCNYYSYTVEYFYKCWIDDDTIMKERLNRFQPIFDEHF